MLVSVTTAKAESGKARRGRPPKDAPALGRAKIVEAALALAEEEGLEGISMRKVAARLGVDPMSLYNHIASKEALLDAMAAWFLENAHLPQPAGDLRDDLFDMAHAFRRVALRHPRAAPLVLTRQLATLDALGPSEVVLARIRRAGFTPEDSVHILRALLAFIVGTLLREVAAGPTFSGLNLGGVERRAAELTESGLTHVAEAATWLATCDHHAEFEFGLDLVIRAVAERAAG